MHLKFNGSTPLRPGYVTAKIWTVMKMTSLLLLIGFLHVSGKALPQTITLSMKQAPVKKVFKEIRKQSGHLFLYDEKLISPLKNVDVQLNSVPLKQALEQVLKGSGLEFEIVEKNIVLRREPLALPRFFAVDTTIVPEVSGKVLDETGAALIGATVLIKGTTIGVAADVNGAFKLKNVSKNAVLIVRFTGYTTREINLDGRASLQVSMVIDNSKLDEVVVVGYGAQKKANLTGAVDQVSGQDMEDRPVTRISQALQGMVGNLNITTTSAGGAPNATQNINVRGYTGLGTAGAPLVVVDGVPGGDLNAINPSDIESISIIKDAASAAIYGSSAPYGALLITTKQGKKGKAPSISYNNNLSWATPINMPKMLNSLEFAEFYNEAFVNAARAKVYDDATIQRIKDYQAGTMKDETIKSPTANSWQSWGAGNANNDWFDIYFKDVAFSQQHNVGVTGGGSNSTYYIGLGYNDRQGMYNFGDDKYKRFNVRANMSSDLTSWMTINLRSSLTREVFNSPNTYGGRTGGNYMHQIARKFPTVPLFNPDGHYSETSDVLLHGLGGRLNRVKDGIFLTGEFVFKLAKGWNFTTNYTFDGFRQGETNHTKTVVHYLPDGTTANISGTFPNGFSRSDINSEHHVINAFTSYENKFGNHEFKVLGGYIKELTSYTSFSASNSQLYSDNVPSLSLAYGTSPGISDFIRKLAVEGFFGRINYAFKDKYLLELNGRYDGTSRFLKDVRWKFYPGVSAGWNLHREEFWQPIAKVVTSFKVRGSYGALGDQSFIDPDASNPNYYPFYPSLGTTRPTSTNWLFGGAQQAMVTMPGLVNNDLTWVTTSTLNLGADASFFNNRLTASFDWYVRKANNFAGPSQVLPTVLGTGVPTANNADIETRGLELMLNWADRVGNVNYRVRGVLSDYRGKILKYPNPTGLNTTWYTGQGMGDIWGYTTVGYFTANDEEPKGPRQTKISSSNWTAGDIKYADLDGNNIIDWGNNTLANPGDRRVIGNSTPRYSYSFIGEANWKGFDFYVFLQGVAKREAWVGSNYFWGVIGDEWQSSPFTVHRDRWSPTNPNGYFPKFYMSGENGKNTQVQTKYLQNAAYMRIKNVQVGYTLPSSLISRIKAQKVRMYVSLENLATFTRLVKTMDPELSIGDAKIYPLQRTYSLGLNVTF
ncbi:SusC/RagA family TonB-linked outer membrane protein [Chitinophaga lutea]|uniref:SusC/RagA family TonB-linked outer membrane protein n=2 Tax=Chitinophaga lutea TaxID=2488634 RepID=A0A3N4PXG9_9BACT|nr:SusC/RagA family TonB-linked outer membrane protein [Chitinophaga lutea]